MLPPHPPRQPLDLFDKSGSILGVGCMWYAPRNAGERTTDVLSGKRDKKAERYSVILIPRPPGDCGPYDLSWVAAGRLKPWGKSLRSARPIRALIGRGFLSCRLQKTAACPPKTYPHSARHNTHYVSLPQGLRSLLPTSHNLSTRPPVRPQGLPVRMTRQPGRRLRG